MAADISCPTWCEFHRQLDAGDTGTSIVHYGSEKILELAEVVLLGVVRRFSVRVSARDDGESRRCVIEIVDPHGVGAGLTVDETRCLVGLLIDAADLRFSSSDGDCPPWCQEHTDPDPDDPDDEREHRGPYHQIVAAGTHHPHITIGVRLRAFDEEYQRRVSLEVLVQSVSTELLAAEACRMAAHLLDCVDLAELVDVA
ncbi:hypothetical protein ACTD5D_09515 [Nocardia takedensis]|uniref:hypothetical protein n=1 Tax=Nocardia takedensis TaxID=259390 RepID=UPI003F7728CA